MSSLLVMVESWQNILQLLADSVGYRLTGEAPVPELANYDSEELTSSSEAEDEETSEDETSEVFADIAGRLSDCLPLPQSCLENPSDFYSDSDGEEFVKVVVKDNHGQIHLKLKDVS